MTSSDLMARKIAQGAPFTITPVRTEEDIQTTKALFYEYTKWLNLDLSFQFFEVEMADFPGKYAPPNGELLLAKTEEGLSVGCGAMRPISDDICEMKRLWVNDSAKGLGIGRALAVGLIDAARKLGYKYMRLDSLSRMTTALKLYDSLGFYKIDPYYEVPFQGIVFLELDLTSNPD